ncbi:N-acetyltransferase family protein [Geodermatophilus sp. URMC 61]|uniref:N-acetyltransferase family protein n=1 Tax=Geodermatophilus sp. URMC 61 TaxID=3423411 RepID=UPI00406CDA99
MDITVDTRPVRPDDGPLFCRLWDRLSPETIYRRFHAPLRRTPVDAARLVEVDHDLREALVAVVGGEVVGVARYDRSPDDPATADVAVVVEDGWQGFGVGRQLLGELTELAARRGVRSLTADVQADNDRVVGLVRRLLPGAVLTPDHGVYTVQSPLPGAPVPAAA